MSEPKDLEDWPITDEGDTAEVDEPEVADDPSCRAPVRDHQRDRDET